MRRICFALFLLLFGLLGYSAQGAVALNLSLNGPTNGATLGMFDQLVVRITAGGDTLTNVNVYTNGVLLYSRSTAPFSKTNSVTLRPGTYTIYASGDDSSAGVAATNTFTNTFTVLSNTIPLMNVLHIPNNAVPIVTNAFPFRIGDIGAVGSTNIGTSVSSKRYLIKQGQGFGFWVHLGQTNTGSVAPTVFIFELSPDGTNYWTRTNMQMSIPMNGVTRVADYTNFPASLVDNAFSVRVRQIDILNTNRVFVTNAYFTSY